MIEQLKQLGFQKDPETFIWKGKNQKDFAYSDGDETENYILNSIRTSADKSVYSSELSNFIKDWPTLYHLSSRRSNIIRPFANYLKGKKVLEIGCGCGALSRYLAEIGSNLISVEGSPRRALITRERCKGFENVEVVTATSELVAGLRGFDVVILNGVLEYSPKFLGVNGHLLLLKTCFEQLHTSGILILAIENQLGIKYFSGQPEDHAGMPMYGINDSYREGEFKTWGKKELNDLIRQSGFNATEQFVPLPDYKLPVSVITPLGWERYSQDLTNFAIDSVCQDPQTTPHSLFSLEKAYQTTWKNGLATDMANSFLMIASKTTLATSVVPLNIAAFHFMDDIGSGFNKAVEIFEEESILKIKSYPLDMNFKEGATIDYSSPEKYISRISLWIELLQILNHNDWTIEEIVNWSRSWIEALKEKIFGLEELNINRLIDSKFWSFTPMNSYRGSDGRIYFLDIGSGIKGQIDFRLVIYHGLRQSFKKITSVASFKGKIDLSYQQLIERIFHDVFLVNLEEKEMINLKMREQAMNDSTFNSLGFSLSNGAEVLVQRPSISELKSAIVNLEDNLYHIQKSLSWKFTSPIRKFIRIIRNIFK